MILHLRYSNKFTKDSNVWIAIRIHVNVTWDWQFARKSFSQNFPGDEDYIN